MWVNWKKREALLLRLADAETKSDKMISHGKKLSIADGWLTSREMAGRMMRFDVQGKLLCVFGLQLPST